MLVRHVPGRRLRLPVREVLARGRRRVLKSVAARLRRAGWLLAVGFACACGSAPFAHATGGGAGGGGGGGGGTGTGGGGGTSAFDAGLALSSACTTLNMKRCDYYAQCGLIENSEPALRD